MSQAARNPVGWFEIYVQDISRAKKFYEGVFGVRLAELPSPVPGLEMWAFPMVDEAYGSPGALVKMEGGPSTGGCGTLIYFSCDDCSVEESRVAGAGGVVERSKFPIGPYGFISFVKDSEGNMIGLHSRA
ncbi:MAG: VOC family protein [Verrucomicrobiales bacterium]|nr:VOC family protein [Verrucomicrobiales bacterium]